MNKKILFLISGLTFLLVMIIVIYVSLNQKQNETTSTTDSGNPINIFNKVTLNDNLDDTERTFHSVTSVPTLHPSEGSGIDLDSEVVKVSQQELSKLRSKLPYIADLDSSDNTIQGEIVIPPLDFNDNNWTLVVHIFGPNYQLQSQDEDYNQNKQAFIEGVNQVLSWLKNNNIDSNKIIVEWGDTEIVKKTSEQWLLE